MNIALDMMGGDFAGRSCKEGEAFFIRSTRQEVDLPGSCRRKNQKMLLSENEVNVKNISI